MFISVVFPAPLPPATMMLSRPRTQAARNCNAAAVAVPFCSRSIALNGTRRNFRMVSVGPARESGGMIALTRLPSGSRASTIGLDSSHRRPRGATIRWITRMTWSASLNVMSVLYSLPSRSTQTCLGPFTMISENWSSAMRSWIGPYPTTSANTASCRRRRSVRFTVTFSSSSAAGNCSVRSARIESGVAVSSERPSVAASRAWTRLTMWASVSSRRRLIDSVSGCHCSIWSAMPLPRGRSTTADGAAT